MEQFLLRIQEQGADTDSAMERFLGDKALYFECLSQFITDPSFLALKQAIEERNYDRIFNYAHTLKGVAGNLSLIPIFEAAGNMLNSLKEQNYNDIHEQYEKIVALKCAFSNLLE